MIVKQRTYDELMTQDEIYQHLNRVQVNEDPWQTALSEGQLACCFGALFSTVSPATCSKQGTNFSVS